jgi:hypothetical protein
LYILRKESRFSEFDTMCLNGERNQWQYIHTYFLQHTNRMFWYLCPKIIILPNKCTLTTNVWLTPIVTYSNHLFQSSCVWSYICDYT